MAKQAREQQLFWVGPMHPVTGEPAEWFSGIPARDLDETDIAHLTDADYETALNCGFYQKSEPTGDKAEEQKAAAKQAAAAPSAPEQGKEG
jgi:hypothetical protein